MKVEDFIEELQKLPASTIVGSFDQQYVPKFHSASGIDFAWELIDCVNDVSVGVYDYEDEANTAAVDYIDMYIESNCGYAFEALGKLLQGLEARHNFAGDIVGQYPLFEIRKVAVIR